jgi:hypothetical protein
VSEKRVWEAEDERLYDVEDLEVYQKLCRRGARWVVREHPETYSDNSDIVDSGWPIPPET